MIPWLGFLACSIAILLSGYRLSIDGDVIAEKTGMGRSWVGLALIAAVTSLPELISGISAVSFADAPDIATGGVLGSCVFNLFILAVMDSFVRGDRPITSLVSQGNLLAAAMGMALISVAVLGLSLVGMVPAIGFVGFYTPLIIIGYLISMRIIFVYTARENGDNEGEPVLYDGHSLRQSVISFGLNSCVVIVAAVFLPVTGQAIAAQTGLGDTFVGNIFIALSTSLPELVVSISAVRMGAVDMAAGNVFGSNMFNLLILAIDDIFYTKGPILTHSQPTQIVPAVIALVMTAVVLAAIVYKPFKRRLPVGMDSVALGVMFLLNMWLLLSLRAV